MAALQNGSKSCVLHSRRKPERYTRDIVAEEEGPLISGFLRQCRRVTQDFDALHWKSKKPRCFVGCNVRAYEQYWSQKMAGWIQIVLRSTLLGSILRYRKILKYIGSSWTIVVVTNRDLCVTISVWSSSPSFSIEISGFGHGFNISK